MFFILLILISSIFSLAYTQVIYGRNDYGKNDRRIGEI
jgi:hypothetical protein